MLSHPRTSSPISSGMSTPSTRAPFCSVCCLVPPKYCCPCCPGPVRTCSLPCYKRHQQRASCNGKRDPAAYIKKSQLATPVAIDRDYNFLTALQRQIEDAAASTHGDSSRPLSTQRNCTPRRKNTDGRFNQYLYENRITVNRAPVGMSRQVANHSRYLPKSNKVVWTVEWLIAVGVTAAVVEIAADATVAESYVVALREQQRLNKKRKRAEEPESRRVGLDNTTVPPADNRSSISTVISGVDQTVLPSVVEDDSQIHTEPEQPTTRKHYYLLRPRTNTRDRVVIPIKESDTLTSSLSTRIVLEFPTYYALDVSEQDLPPGFMTEETFLHSRRLEQTTRRDENLVSAKIDSREEQLDDKSILDLLRRDTSIR